MGNTSEPDYEMIAYLNCVKVELTKLRATPGAEVQPGNWNTYECGAENNGASLPVDYVLTGFLLEPVQLGKTVRILRTTRNGVSLIGRFESTVVVQISDEGFWTRNSIYRLRRLNGESVLPAIKANALCLKIL